MELSSDIRDGEGKDEKQNSKSLEDCAELLSEKRLSGEELLSLLQDLCTRLNINRRDLTDTLTKKLESANPKQPESSSSERKKVTRAKRANGKVFLHPFFSLRLVHTSPHFRFHEILRKYSTVTVL